MKLSVLKEVEKSETRVAIVPNVVSLFAKLGFEVNIENNAGNQSGYSNKEYENSGAKIVKEAEEIFKKAEIIVKVKEPQMNEIKMIREDQVIFTYLHLYIAELNYKIRKIYH